MVSLSRCIFSVSLNVKLTFYCSASDTGYYLIGTACSTSPPVVVPVVSVSTSSVVCNVGEATCRLSSDGVTIIATSWFVLSFLNSFFDASID